MPLPKGRVLFGSPIGQRVFDSIVLPNGRRAVVIDKDAHERAVRSANATIRASLADLAAEQSKAFDEAS